MGYDPNLIVTMNNRTMVIDSLTAIGFPSVHLSSLTNVELANLYHGQGGAPSPSDIQRETSRAIVATMMALGPSQPFDEELVRYLARVECEKMIAALPPQRIEIVTPAATVTINGPLHYRTEMVIRVASIGHPILLVGPAGCGKTTIADHTARALQLPFNITSTINDTHELLGFVDGYGRYHPTPFRLAYENGGLWTADEIDAWDAAALLAANSALANGYCNFPDRPEPIMRHPMFRMVATANTFGTGADRVYVGRNELDAASLDRFATIDVDYDVNLERMFANGADRWLEHVWKIRRAVDEKKIRHVVSSRAVAMGAAALAIGLDWSDVEAFYLFKGMSDRDRKKING